MIQEEDKEAYEDTFNSFDIDGNGTIDIHELQLGLSKQDGTEHSFSETGLKDLLKRFDTNENSVLERNEFVNLMNSTYLEDFFTEEEDKANKERGLAFMTRAESTRAFQDTFKSFDLDGTQTIDINELQIGLSTGRIFSVAALKDLLDKFDVNNNGVLERDEFANLLHSEDLEEFLVKEEAKANNGHLELEAIYMQRPTPEETPTFVEEKITDFNKRLNNVDTKKKTAYVMAQEKSPHLCGDDFKLAFLRSEVFDVKQAVDRWIKYWDKRLEIFGKEKAFLPMTCEGAMKGYEKVISSNYVAVAEGATDPDGRAIMLVDYRKEAGDDTSEDLLKVMWYQLHRALESELAQKRGIVIYCKCGTHISDWRVSLSKKSSAFTGTIPMRLAALHVVSPPVHITILIKISKVLLGAKLRKRIYVHTEPVVDILGSLSKFGLGTKDKLPEIFGGDLVFSTGPK